MQKKGIHIEKAALRAEATALFVGEEVFALLSDEDFQAGWDALYGSCPWATVFQSRAFVATWYRIYQAEYLPILVKAEQQGRLTGLLTMALPLSCLKGADLGKAKGKIVGAGQYEAEYQVWLGEESNGASFIQDALEQIRSNFPTCDIHFRYIPPLAPLSWAKVDQKWQRKAVLYTCCRPLMDLNDAGLPKLFRKSEYRNKLNRLKKKGKFSFEQITTQSDFSSIVNFLTVQYDFRQGAMFNKNQFRENPLKKDFMLAKFEQQLLHVSVLKVDEEIMASIVAVVGKGWVHLGGINIHIPFNAHYYSPGFVHFLMLGQQLSQSGFDVFDLTPGGDSYKERMSTDYDQVYELVIASTSSVKVKTQLRNRIFSRLVKAGVRPMSVQLSLKRKLYLLKARMRALKSPGVVVSMIYGKINELAGLNKHRMYAMYRGSGSSSSPIPVQVNCVSDFLNFEQTDVLTRWEFLEEAMRRFESGERSYTWSEGGHLLACAWRSASKPATDGDHQLPEGAVLLQGFYCHPAGRGRLKAFLETVAGEVAREPGVEEVYAKASSLDSELCRTLEELPCYDMRSFSVA